MKPLKAILLFAGVCAVSPLLITHSHSNDSVNIPYQINDFDFIKHQLPHSENYQTQWNRMTGFEHSGLHWEQFVVVYTDIGEDVYKHNFLQYSTWFDDPEDEDNQPNYKTYPIGTTFIKENYSMKNGKPDKAQWLTIMIKREQDFNPEGGNWEYMQFNVNGEAMINGSSIDNQVNSQCAQCHQNVAERDYIFSNIYSGTYQ